MEIYNTGDKQAKPPVVVLIYGHGGVGKTTFASTAPKPILADCEGGAKYFGLRGIKMDVAVIKTWTDMGPDGFMDIVKGNDYETIVIDPIGELMDKLMHKLKSMNDSKLTQKDGSPTMSGWGWLKETMRNYFKVLRDSGKHIIFIAHIDEKSDEDRMVKRPKIATKLSEELVNLVDIVGYMTIVGSGEDTKRVILVDPETDKYIAKDRTGQLGKIIEPNFSKIIQACQGTKSFSWSKPGKPVEDKKPTKAGKNPPEFLEPTGEENEPAEPTEEEKKTIKKADELGKKPKSKLAKSANEKLAKYAKK